MPLLEISTNTAINDAQNIARLASKLTAEILGKPESYVMIRIHEQQAIFFAGSNEPAAHVKLKSLGLPENHTAEFSEQLCSFIKQNLGINSSRIYIEFSSPERHLWGWDGRTF